MIQSFVIYITIINHQQSYNQEVYVQIFKICTRNLHYAITLLIHEYFGREDLWQRQHTIQHQISLGLHRPRLLAITSSAPKNMRTTITGWLVGGSSTRVVKLNAHHFPLVRLGFLRVGSCFVPREEGSRSSLPNPHPKIFHSRKKSTILSSDPRQSFLHSSNRK